MEKPDIYIVSAISIVISLALILVTPAASVALDKGGLNIAWKIDLKAGSIDARPLVSDSGIYVLGSGVYDWSDSTRLKAPCLIKLDHRGNERWRREIDSDTGYELCGPLLAEGKVWVLGGSGTLVKFSLGGEEEGKVKVCKGPVTASPLYYNGRVWCLSPGGNLTGIDPDSMEIRKRIETGHPIYYSSPVPYHDMLVFGTDDGWVLGIDPDSGRERIRVQLGTKVRTTAVRGDLGLAISGSTEGGGSRWVIMGPEGDTRLDRTYQGHASSPLYSAGLYFFPSDNRVHIIGTGGEEDRKIEVSGPVAGMDSAADTVFITTNINQGGEHSSLYRYDIETGTLDSREMTPHEWCLCPPTVFNDMVVTANDAGYLFVHEMDPEVEQGVRQGGPEIVPLVIISVTLVVILIMIGVKER